jgi:arylsulfatase A-like enzyme
MKSAHTLTTRSIYSERARIAGRFGQSTGRATTKESTVPDRPGHEPEAGFPGRIARTVAESAPWWPKVPLPTGPNVVVILLDDVGFGQFGCYGSSIATPNIDALAADGLRYTNFHVAALCSPTRASLLTGRNHHSVGVGFLGAFDTGFPSYRGAISPTAATLAEMLKGVGYSSYAVGKWHLTPSNQMSPAGPFDQWPTQRGFDRYYGFLWGEDDQYRPELWYDQHRVEVPDDPDYHFSKDMADRATEFLSDHLTGRPDHPFFCYLAFGAGHAPHHAPRDYVARYRGRFDHGWDVERQRILERQIALGVVPEGTELSPRNPGVPAWNELSGEEQRLFARMQEVFAGFMEHTDEQIGRVVSFLRTHGLLEDSVVMVLTDNGASGEGGRNGTINEYRYFLGLDDDVHEAMAAIDDLGGPLHHNQYPAGWAQAGNTPLKFYKKYAHGGGVRAPLVIHWPERVRSAGEVRTQFHHVIDVVPTVLELAGVPAPESYRGVEQLPIHGTSMSYSFDSPSTPSTRTTQYFETAGNRGIYADGWKAIAAHAPGEPFDRDRWELYHVERDVAETRDLAAEHPDRVRELELLWWSEAEAYDVLPLDDRMGERVKALDPGTDRRSYTMLPGTRLLNHVVGPSFSERAFTVSAPVVRNEGEDGVLLAYGRRAFGFAFFVKGGLLMADYNLAGLHTILVSDIPVPDGASLLQLAVERTGSAILARLRIDGTLVAEAPLPRLIPGGIGTLSIQCGHNAPSPVSDEYTTPFRFTGSLDRVTIDLGPREHDIQDDAAQAELTFQ